jgi:hypothetical protein
VDRFNVSKVLISNFGWILVGYVLVCVAGVCASVRTGKTTWLSMVLVLSTFGMFTLYWAMGFWPITLQMFPIAALCVLVLLLSFNGLFRNPMGLGAILALAFATNVIGSLWTYGILQSKDSF